MAKLAIRQGRLRSKRRDGDVKDFGVADAGIVSVKGTISQIDEPCQEENVPHFVVRHRRNANGMLAFVTVGGIG